MSKIVYIFLSLFLVVSCTKKTVILDGEPTPGFSLPLILNLNGKDCFYDDDLNLLKYPISNNELQNFQALVKFQNEAEVLFNKQISLQNNHVNSFGDLEYHKPYDLQVKLLDKTLNLKFIFTNLTLARVVTYDDIKNDPKSLAKLTVNYANYPIPSYNKYIGIEIRGKSSVFNDKKSYGFAPLQTKALKDVSSSSFFNFETNHKWALDALFTDKSKVRNKVCFELWSSLSSVSIESEFLELFVNNKSLGLYRLSEIYTDENLNLSNNSSMHEGIDNSTFTKFLELPANMPSGKFWADWEQVYPDPSEKDSWDDFYELSRLITTASNAEFNQKIFDQLDINNTIDYYLFMSLCDGYDNLGKNWFFLKKDQTQKFKILLWDLDATWGRTSQGYTRSYNKTNENNLFSRLLELNTNDFRNKVKNRWELLRSNQFSEATIKALFESNLNQLANYNAEELENTKWNSNFNIQAEKQYINSWISNRLIFLDNYFSNL